MELTGELLVVISAVTAAVAYLTRRWLAKPKSGGCGGSGACGCAKPSRRSAARRSSR